MEKRLFLAIVLSIFVLIIYSIAASKFLPNPQQVQHSQGSVTDIQSQTAPVEKLTLDSTASQDELISIDSMSSFEELISLENKELQLMIDRRGTGIKEARIIAYDFLLPQKNMGYLLEWKEQKFKEYDVSSGKLLSYDDREQGLEVRKLYRFLEDKFILEMKLEFINHSTTNTHFQYALNIASMSEKIIKKNPAEQRYMEFSIALPDKVLRKHYSAFTPPPINGQLNWIGVRDRYFCSIVKPLQEVDRVVKNVNSGIISYVLQSKPLELLPGQSTTHTYKIYIGPQKQEYISKLGAGCENIINYGFFDTLSQMLLAILRFLNGICKNWGLTLVVFSILVFIIMSPLSIKSFSSMKRMQDLQPVIEELRAKYKDSPQKMNKEIMELYREKKINPLGGCLPVLFQMPIFISLFQLLMRFVDLKGVNFLWIKDLSEPDRLFVLPYQLPLIGNEINLLPLIMIITMLVQQKLTTGKQATGGLAGQQQKMMSLFMAIFFGIIFYHMPAGLVLYWSVNSLLMLVFQLKLFGRVTATAKT